MTSMKVLSLISSTGENAPSTVATGPRCVLDDVSGCFGLHTARPEKMNSRPPSAWSFCALTCFLFKERVGKRKKFLNQVPSKDHAPYRRGGDPPPLTKTEAGELPACSAESHLSQEVGQEKAAR